ncbi:hypothetical protein DFH27DRAFT_522359 [Peziza echinospora]|nr:hypothetical protein DFH27DRAFT_522359 [Peziza echinospora]
MTSLLQTIPRATLTLLILLLNTSISSAYVLQRLQPLPKPEKPFRLQSRQTDPPADGLIMDPAPAPTMPVVSPRPTRPIDDSFLSDEGNMMMMDGAEAHWGAKHSLIVALVISLASLSFMVMLLYIWANRRKERKRREQATKKGRAMMASTTELGDKKNVWGWGRMTPSSKESTSTSMAESTSEVTSNKPLWAKGAFWQGDAGIMKPGRTAK